MKRTRIMKMRRSLLIILFLLATYSVAHEQEQPGASIQPDNLFPMVEMQTSAGKIKVELDRLKAPITTNNFLYYVSNKSYDGTIFHRVEKDFVVQGGGYNEKFKEREKIEPIFNESGNGLKNEAFTIAMARESDPHSAMRQFYFNLADNEGLDPGKSWGYTVFGIVSEGEEVLELIGGTPTHVDATFDWENVPVKPILINKILVLKQQ